MMSELSEWFWQERLWFPEGLGWADLEDRDGRVYAKARDLWVALPIALVFLIVRQIFERSVYLSLCLAQFLCPSSLPLVVNWNICFSLFLNIFVPYFLVQLLFLFLLTVSFTLLAFFFSLPFSYLILWALIMLLYSLVSFSDSSCCALLCNK